MSSPVAAAGQVDLGGLLLANPVMVAAGCGGTGRELAAYSPLADLGAFVTRSISLDPRPSAPPPCVAESPAGLVHATGLPSPGLEGFLATELPWLVQHASAVVVSVAAPTLGEHAELARRLGSVPGIAAVEVNVSAPDDPGVLDGREPFHVGQVVATVRRGLPGRLPVLAKVRADLPRVVESARAATDSGAAAVVVGNALPATLPDGRPAGLSGPAIAPLSLRCVAVVTEALPDVAVVGCGGITSAADVRAHLRAGARAVQVGTAVLHDPTTPARLVAGLTSSATPPPHPREQP